ncbi:ORF6N domain-containing protein [Escherichia coli]|uniref:P22AR C-terminal domain-containing protein n=1 Tax=Escherichia coli TaxID=562 RepID=UPI000DA579C1|nr:P22AR C-terminal domain-containing protein [Escherichia coli]EBB8759111.1 phage antirepressor Ant [Salmonella enterica]EDI3773885.1 phage antirepressor Ant [Salmonella enterica subsp. enterica serovar Typhimurium]EDU8360328.1 phage antirepressor Ant [Salmonella enterica subsp. enterica serovar Typhimurium var. 5-]EFO2087288.1 phage antirepressor Ant [Escherichia coli O109]EEE5102656.1 phage antirepressor Ant [Salmonella enterica subsp. enterica serovar Typhimurium var. 5-]
MTVQVTVKNLSPVTYNQIPVITTELLARLYGTEAIRIQQNHHENKSRFIEGKHFFKAVGDELKNLRLVLSESQNAVKISPKTRSLILWTERGAARHAKMLETDQAWDVFEKLEDCYFSQCEKNTGKQGKSTREFSAQEANSLVWLWDYANRSQALFRELYPALKLIQSNYSGRCHDYGHEFSYIIGMARDVLINHTRDVDINEPDGPTNLSAWVRLKNKELPPSLHRY